MHYLGQMGSESWTRTWATFAGHRLGDLRRLTMPHEEAAVRRNLIYFDLASGANPSATDQLVKSVFRAFGLFVVEFLMTLPKGDDRVSEAWDWQGLTHLETLNRGRRGWILVGAHTGNWEQLGAIGRRVNRRIVAPVGTQFSPVISPLVKRIKLRRGIESLPVDRSPRPLLRALDRGHLVALPLDGGSFIQGRTTTLLDKPVRLASGAAHLSKLSGSPILPVFSRRTSLMKQIVRIIEPIWPDQVEQETGKRPVDIITDHLMDQLSAHLTDSAGQWCIFRSLVPGQGSI